MINSVSKRVITTLLVLLVAVASIAITASAATTEEEHGGAYGYIIPTDSNLSAQKSSYTFYGNSTTLYFMIFSTGKENSYFNVEIYSSNDYNPDNIVSSYTRDYPSEKGSVPLALDWPFKSNPSGTYYGRCYTSIVNGEDQIIDKSTICKFTININRLGKETVSLTSVSNTNSGVVIKWTGLSTAVKYRIYRKTANDKSWTAIANVNAGTTSYTDKNVKSGVKYTYTVKAFDNLYASLYEKAGLSTVYLTTPKLTPSGSSTNVYPVIKWSKVEGCQGYIIYRKGGSLNDSTKWTQVAKVTNPSTLTYTDKTATSADWKYTYTVRAYYNSYKSSFDSTGVDYEYVTAPTLKSASNVYGGVKITWLDTNTVDKKFYIYRKATGEKNWTRIGTAKTASFTDKKVTNGITYTYTVRTASSTNASSYNTKGISTMYITTPELSKISIDKNGKVTVKWNAVTNATGYVLYRRVNDSNWSQIATTNSKTLSYNDTTTKVSGEKYTYTVRALNNSYRSYFVSSGISTMFLSIPKVELKNDFTQENGSCVKVSWNTITGAKNYRVYRKASTDNSWKVLADNVAEKVYYDKTAESGVKYYYTVRAKHDSFLSAYTATNLFTVLSTPLLTDATITDAGVKVTWEKVSGAENYSVFRRTPSGAWENIGTTSTNEFVDSTENATKTSYLYTVRANLGDLKSNYMINGIANFITLDSLDVLFEENKDADTAHVTITWKGSGAESYEIYRSENGATATLLTTVPATQAQSYVDKTISQGYTYVYTVKPIKNGKLAVTRTSEKIKWEFPPISVVDVLATPYYANTELDNRIEIIWNPVEAAETYDIYRKTVDTDWVYLATVSKNAQLSYVDTAIETDVIYYYSVKGISADRDSLFDDKGTEAMLKGPIEPVEDIFAQLSDDPTGNGEKIVTLAWAANEKASLYKVMRKAGPDGEWEFMGLFLSCELLVFTDYSIEQGVTYTYTVHTYAPDRPSVDNMVGKTIIWPSDNPPAEDTTTGNGDETTTTPDTTLPNHIFSDATCTEPQTCTICGKTQGEALGHKYVLGECTLCNEYDPSYCPKLFLNGDMSEITNPNQTDKKIICNVNFQYRSAEQTSNGAAKVKIQGNSSIGYPKKNYTINFFEDNDYSEKMKIDLGWGNQSKYCLKANWVDKTHSRNIITARLVGEMQRKYNLFQSTPNNGAVDGFPIEVYINGNFHGLYTMNIPKDEWTFNMDKDNANHIVISGNNWNDPCLFKAVPTDFSDWELEIGEENDVTLKKVQRLVDFVLNSSDEEFKANIDKYLDLDATLNYYIMMKYAYLADNIGKNMLLATYDGLVWYPVLYDLDTSWGTTWDGADIQNYKSTSILNSNRSILWQRIEKLYKKDLAVRYFELRKDVLEPTHIIEMFENYYNSIPDEVIERENKKWTTPETVIPGFDISQIEDYLNTVIPKLDQKFAEWK